MRGKVRCPNRKRRKRLGPGGGTLACPGRLEVRVLVPVTVALKGWGPKHSGSILPPFDDAFPARLRRHGVRVKAATLAAVYTRGNGADIRCSDCGWSLVTLFERVQRAAHRRGRR